MASVAAGFSDVLVLCDGESDRWLFNRLKAHHPALREIPAQSVSTYGQARTKREYSALEQAVRPLHQDDRPDFIFCRGDRPLLVVELTQHAYTGDNGLQRFARFAAAAEQGVPFIYFGPKSRVRDDELDGIGRASPRSLTSDLFEGMRCLAAVHGAPQLYVEWKTDRSGLPAALPASATAVDVAHLYGELLNVIATILEAQMRAGSPFSLLQVPAVASLQRKTDDLADTTNTRSSDVRIDMTAQQLREVVLAPSRLEGFLVDNDYFNKGKPDKLLALHALRKSVISTIQLPDETLLTGERARGELEALMGSAAKFSSPGMVYYTGYKWRSDPHAGVLVNIDYRLCRRAGEASPAARRKPLVVVYPRVSLSPASAVWRSLSAISSSDPGSVVDLFRARYPVDWEEKISCLSTKNPFSLWTNRTKQARIFRRYADLIVLNDGVVVGDALAGEYAHG